MTSLPWFLLQYDQHQTDLSCPRPILSLPFTLPMWTGWTSHISFKKIRSWNTQRGRVSFTLASRTGLDHLESGFPPQPPVLAGWWSCQPVELKPRVFEYCLLSELVSKIPLTRESTRFNARKFCFTSTAASSVHPLTSPRGCDNCIARHTRTTYFSVNIESNSIPGCHSPLQDFPLFARLFRSKWLLSVDTTHNYVSRTWHRQCNGVIQPRYNFPQISATACSSTSRYDLDELHFNVEV